MKRKKLIAIIFVLLHSFMLVSCGKSSTEIKTETQSQEVSSTTEETSKSNIKEEKSYLDMTDEELKKLTISNPNPASDFYYSESQKLVTIHGIQKDSTRNLGIVDVVSQITGIIIPQNIDGGTVYQISYTANVIKGYTNSLRKIDNLGLIVMPDTVKKLSDNTFRECHDLKRVVLSNSLEEIPQLCFYGCLALETINIPNSVKKIGCDVFTGCTSLKEVYIPESVKEIQCKFPENVEVQVAGGSYAEKYCYDKNIPCVIVKGANLD